ncbi:MAG: hypothetical protein Tsb0010_08690 [Parvularculaceae bacterium]
MIIAALTALAGCGGEPEQNGEARIVTPAENAALDVAAAAAARRTEPAPAVAYAPPAESASAPPAETASAAEQEQAAPAAAAIETFGVSPIPRRVEFDAELAALGERLYHDPVLSIDGSISCSTCHLLHKGGTDQLPVSRGVGGALGGVNAPTTYNSAQNFAQFWDGRAATLEEQALGPVENPIEMANSWPNAVQSVSADPEYRSAFETLFGGEISRETIARAIAEFERTLITPDSRFDDYLRGDASALTQQEIRGFRLFNELGCASCHTGDYFGGESFQVLNAQYFEERGGPIEEGDLGRFNVTGQEADRHAFKIPMLRNVAVTFPYFHDGQVADLATAVRLMARLQLGLELEDDEADAIVAFLEALTGQYRGAPLDRVAPR